MKSCFWFVNEAELTESQAVSWELPFVAVVGQTVALLIQRNLVGVHDDGQVPRL